jgi:hypothetical protein
VNTCSDVGSPFKPHPWSRTEPKIGPYDHTFWRPFRVNSIPRFLSLATVFLQRLYVFSSPYISPTPIFLRPLHFLNPYISPATTLLQPRHFSGHYFVHFSSSYISLATIFSPAPTFPQPLQSSPYISLATTLLWPRSAIHLHPLRRHWRGCHRNNPLWLLARESQIALRACCHSWKRQSEERISNDSTPV